MMGEEGACSNCEHEIAFFKGKWWHVSKGDVEGDRAWILSRKCPGDGMSKCDDECDMPDAE